MIQLRLLRRLRRWARDDRTGRGLAYLSAILFAVYLVLMIAQEVARLFQP